MFRITTHTVGDELMMKLEGCLIGMWVGELESCWREATTSAPGLRLHVDLTDVCHVDDAARNLITAMFETGVHFIARGCVMPELVKEIARSVSVARGT